jgi:hypothetical protein
MSAAGLVVAGVAARFSSFFLWAGTTALDHQSLQIGKKRDFGLPKKTIELRSSV